MVGRARLLCAAFFLLTKPHAVTTGREIFFLITDHRNDEKHRKKSSHPFSIDVQLPGTSFLMDRKMRTDFEK